MSDENNKGADLPNKETSKILYSDLPKYTDSLSGKLEMGGLPLYQLVLYTARLPKIIAEMILNLLTIAMRNRKRVNKFVISQWS